MQHELRDLLFDRLDLPAIFREGTQNVERSKSMSKENNHRVLSRMGARQLTKAELDQVAAAKLTFASVLVTGPVNNPDDSFDQ
jgi:hypothetical protein